MESRFIWPFELLDKLGEGGMGVVYRARYVGNDRQVAVKLLPDDVATNETLLARFERELEVLKQLRHPNIVHCFGGTCESKQQFYAMELVEGGTLAELLSRKERLPWETAVDYALQMCAALQYAHERGIIHRDIKPGNFLLTKSGQIKLSDFGLAAVVSASRITAAGKTLGTIQYMAPEQIRGKPPLTNRADLYALGCVIHEMLTGDPPYLGDSVASVLQQHLKAPIPHVAAEVLDCPLELDQLVFELLSKEVEQRPETAALVGLRLEGILQPGRRAACVNPDLFSAKIPQASIIAPLQGIRSSNPDADIVMFPTRRTVSPPPVAWVVAGLLLVSCLSLWIGWRNTAVRLRHAEKVWVDLLEQSDHPTRLLALSSLGKFGPLSSSTIEKLRAAMKGDSEEIRVASLVVLAQHAAECRSLQLEVFKIQNTDGSPAVRFQAGRTHAAMKQANSQFTGAGVLFWIVIVAILGSAIAGGWWLWERLRKFA